MALLKYDEILDVRGVKIPFVPEIITPKIERPMRAGRYEGGECASVLRLLQKGDRFLELGAGVGLLSATVAMAQKAASITVVEANPDIHPLIRETYRLNGVENVTLLNGAASTEADGVVDFYLHHDFWASSMKPGRRPHVRKISIPRLNINSLLRDHNPTMIACDIEGGEVGLFDNADLSGVRAIVIEFHPKMYGEEGVQEIVTVLEGKGFVIEAVNRPTSVRCFIRSEIVQPGILPSSSRWKDVWPPDDPRFFVATCMKDESPFILEWLAWHKSIGIQDFVVFTNDCTDGTDELLDRLEDLGELRHLPNPALATGSTYFQPAALAAVPELDEFKRSDFFISMDVDEFVNVRVGKGSMPELLAAAGPFDALSMSEINHGSNGHEHFERGLVTEQFVRHQTERPGKWKSGRGVKTIVRVSERVVQYRNHRPDFTTADESPLWLDGSGHPLTSLQDDASQNGIDVRGTYDLISLDHFALRSLESYLVKMFRGDVVIKGKRVGHRYWRLRNQNQDLTSTFERQRPAFSAYLEKLMSDQKLRKLHEECCARHEARIAELLKVDEFRERRQWIFDNAWDAKDA